VLVAGAGHAPEEARREGAIAHAPSQRGRGRDGNSAVAIPRIGSWTASGPEPLDPLHDDQVLLDGGPALGLAEAGVAELADGGGVPRLLAPEQQRAAGLARLLVGAGAVDDDLVEGPADRPPVRARHRGLEREPVAGVGH